MQLLKHIDLPFNNSGRVGGRCFILAELFTFQAIQSGRRCLDLPPPVNKRAKQVESALGG